MRRHLSKTYSSDRTYVEQRLAEIRSARGFIAPSRTHHPGPLVCRLCGKERAHYFHSDGWPPIEDGHAFVSEL